MAVHLETAVSLPQTLLPLQEPYREMEVVGANVFPLIDQGRSYLVYHAPSGEKFLAKILPGKSRDAEIKISQNLIDYFLWLKTRKDKLSRPEFYPQLMDFRELSKVVKKAK